jgi:hypothetical protein
MFALSLNRKIMFVLVRLRYNYFPISTSFNSDLRLRSPFVYRNIRMRKAVEACSGLKIRIGSVNFVDRLTPFLTTG